MEARGCNRLGVCLSWCLCALCISGFICGAAFGQKRLEFGGFLQGSAQFYPRTPNPSDTHAIGAGHFQLWSRMRFSNRISWRSRIDLRIDTHLDIDRHRWTDLSQRGVRQPAGAVSEAYLDMKLGRVDLRAGKQEIRWGRADGFNPTDNLMPYDYLDTFADERLAIPALKADVYAGRARFEMAWVPVYTPSRLPLLGQRWFPRLPASSQASQTPGADPTGIDLTYRDAGGPLPAKTIGNGQWGVRWNQLIPRAEFSLSYFDGFDDLAFFRPGSLLLPSQPRPRLLVSLQREYYRVHVAGADFASEFGAFGVRGEVAYFDQTDPHNRDHLLFVLGLDRTWGDWFAIVQYAGQKVSGPGENSAVFPDLGLRSTLLYRIERTLGPARRLEIKGAFRLRDGDFFIQPIYNITLTNKWLLKLGGSFFGGPCNGYLGQFRDNGHLNLQLRYAF